MRIRAVWIITLNKDAVLPLFSRIFPTVEACCKSLLGDTYVGIPLDEVFVKALQTEVGVVGAGKLNVSRDRCNKSAHYPAFEVNLPTNKSLWPVIVLENRGLIYCALPLVSKDIYMLEDKSDVSLSRIPSISFAVEALNGLAQCAPINSSMTSLTHSLILQLHQYLNTCMPFGSVSFSNPSLIPKLINPLSKGKIKHPYWNPVPHKGKSQIVVHIKEEIRCMQFNHSEVKDVMNVYGTVTCKVEVEGMAPEICLTLVQQGGNDQNINGGLVVSPTVSNIEYTPTTSRLRFHPCNNQPLCHYSLPHLTEPPIFGAFRVRINNGLATVYVQLQLQAGVKNQFQQLEVHTPFTGFKLTSLKPNPSMGSVSVQSGNVLVWNVGSKFPTKSLDATMNAVCKLQKLRRKTEMSDEQQFNAADISEFDDNANSFALVLFKIQDYTYSDTRVDPQTVIVSTASKVRCSVTSECVSGQYKIWNADGEVPAVGEMPVQELKSLLI